MENSNTYSIKDALELMGGNPAFKEIELLHRSQDAAYRKMLLDIDLIEQDARLREDTHKSLEQLASLLKPEADRMVDRQDAAASACFVLDSLSALDNCYEECPDMEAP